MSSGQSGNFQFNDSHFHLTNYIHEGPSLRAFLDIVGASTGRVALFGIPLEQQWSYRVSGDHPPSYYLNTDAALYYYSFTDAYIAMAYKALPKEDQAPPLGCFPESGNLRSTKSSFHPRLLEK